MCPYAVGKVGYYLPWSVFGSVLVTIGNGLLTTLSPTTSTGRWIGYQILVGFGRGACMQVVRLSHPPSSFNLLSVNLQANITQNKSP